MPLEVGTVSTRLIEGTEVIETVAMPLEVGTVSTETFSEETEKRNRSQCP